jgi:hypothetical protein
MNTLLIFIWIILAFIAMAFWESCVEGRNAWDKKKLGWKMRIGEYVLSAYHFFLFFVMLPLLLTLPLVIYGWNIKLFGILLSAYSLGMIVEDFGWYAVNPAVRLREFWTEFSDYCPWLKIKGKKIIPIGYILGILISALSWYFLWK